MSDVQSLINEAKRKRRQVIDDTGFKEIAIAVVGNVDSSKSTLVGVLTNPGIFDDGNGLMRSLVFRHPHEHNTGRTSDISYQFYKDDDSKTIFTFMDLAGHEQYLRTTINGISSGYHDLVIVCISDKITQMTLEHMMLANTMKLPMIIAFTKIDQVPIAVTKTLIDNLKKKLSRSKKVLFRIKQIDELKISDDMFTSPIVPYILLSNKTGEGIDLLRDMIKKYPKKEKKFIEGFTIEHVYNVTGYGTVVSGLVGQDVEKGDTLYIGPLHRGDFIEVKVKTLHNDYHNFVDKLVTGKRGCMCITSRDRCWLRPGMVLMKSIPKNICRQFKAKVKILHHHTTLKRRYQAFINCGMIKEPVRFIAIEDVNGNPIDSLRSGDEAIITLEFVKNMNYLEPGQKFIFREGMIRGYGEVMNIL